MAKQVFAFTERGDTVFDPFCGRGTTIFESLLNNRNAAGVDINPVAACVAGAKADVPALQNVLVRLEHLEQQFRRSNGLPIPAGEFFTACFHTETLQQVLFLRRKLEWRSSKVDRFIAAVALGCLHGESHKSPNCLSNRMPRTISTKPEYSVRWWSERGYVPPARNAFEVIRAGAAFRLSYVKAPLRGMVRLRDARAAGNAFPKLKESVTLIVTSPPYLDTTDYQEDQWLRLWLLGGAERPLVNKNRDDRHTSIDMYWSFLTEAWRGCAKLVRRGTIFVIRIGGTRLTKDNLMGGLQETLTIGLADFKIKPLNAGVTTEIKNRQTNVFRPGTKTVRYEHDFSFRLS